MTTVPDHAIVVPRGEKPTGYVWKDGRRWYAAVDKRVKEFTFATQREATSSLLTTSHG